MPHCLSSGWNIIPVVCGIILRAQRDPEEVCLETSVAKTQHRASKYSKITQASAPHLAIEPILLAFFLHELPTET